MSAACPTEEQLDALASGAAPAGAVAQHVEGCAACQAALERLRANQAFLTRHRAGLLRAAQAPGPLLLATDAIPGYRLEGELQRGGQGVVYRATQDSTGQHVAVKVLRDGVFAGRGALERFEREARILGRLSHPGIVAIHDSGAVEGRKYLVTRLVDGAPLDEWVARQAPAARDRGARVRRICELFVAVCDAVHAAHLRGVIHRDLKPGNLLVDAAGRPHVLDFGLAKLTDADEGDARPTLTQTGRFMGSLPWSSPEQTRGVPDDVDLRTDVYSIGVMLFHALTGRFPYDVSGPLRAALEQIANADPPRPSALARGVGRELDTVVLKALAKERARRYQSVAALQRDLERCLRGDPIEARADSAWYLLRKALQRHKIALGAAAGIVLFVLALAVERSRYARSLESALHEANLERARSEARAGNYGLAEQLLWQERLARSGAAARARAYWALWELYARYPCLAAWRERDAVTQVALAPDGQRLLSADEREIRVWSLADLPPRAPSHTLVAPALGSTRPAFSADGGKIVVGCVNGEVATWDATTGVAERRWRAHEGRVQDLGLGDGGQRLATCGADRRVRVWSFADATCEVERSFEAAPARVALSADGAALAIAFPERNTIEVLAGEGFSRNATLDVSDLTAEHDVSGRFRALRFSPAGRFLAAGCYRYACVWDLTTLERAAQHWHEMVVEAVEFGPGDAWLASAGGESIQFWSLQSHQPLHAFAGHPRVLQSLTAAAGHERLASLGQDGVIRLWEARPQGALRRFAPAQTHAVQFSPDGTWLACCGESDPATPQVWLMDWTTGEIAQRLAAPSARMSALAFSPDGRRLAACAYRDPRVRVWNLSTGAWRDIEAAGPGWASLRFSPDGRRLVAGNDAHGRVVTLDADSGAVLELREDHASRVPGLRFSPDGRRLASGERNGALVIRDASGGLMRRLAENPQGVRDLAFSEDGRRLFAAGDDGVVRIWSVATGRCAAQLSGHRGPVYCVALQPGGRLLATGGHDGSIRLWDAEQGRALATLDGDRSVISSLSFHPDGSQLAFGAFGGQVGVWDLTYYQRHIAGNRVFQESSAVTSAPARTTRRRR